MDTKLLEKIGLTPSQAKTYVELIKAGSLTPPQLAQKIGESRTTAYMALSKLEEIGLAHKVEAAKKQTFTPANPGALEKYVAKKRQEVLDAEEQYRDALPNWLTYYYTHRAEPGIKFFQGREGLTKIYEDHLRTQQDVYFVRTQADEQYFGDVLYKYMEQRAKFNLNSHGLAPYKPETYQYAKDNDKRLKRDMSWFPPDAYKSPVEISIYGDKISLISFGDEAIGTIIESPQIAEAMREIFAMAKLGAGVLMERAGLPDNEAC